jgi:hypothetical protein
MAVPRRAAYLACFTIAGLNPIYEGGNLLSVAIGAALKIAQQEFLVRIMV